MPRRLSQLLAAILSLTLGVPTYTYPVGNRKQITSTLAPVPAGLWNYDANDRFTAGDTYDADGNTVSSGGIANVYDFENHLIQKAGVTIVYDGDGNRVSKTVAGVTTTYLVDTLNPTGYTQVVYESFNSSSSGNYELNHSYVYGLELISQTRSYVANFQSTSQKIYYAYDGHGSVRALTGPTGAVTDTYDYDAFGNLIRSSTTLASPTPNNYLFAGEQFDPDLNLYYNRARYLNVSTGRFWSVDTFEGDSSAPLSLHKYLYTSADPVNRIDPGGREDLASLGAAESISEEFDSEDATVKNAAKEKIKDELAPEILIHSTSLSNAYSIDSIGLTSQILPTLDQGIEPSGVFFVFALNTNRQFSLGDLIQAAVSFAADRFKGGDLAYMVGKIPQPVWQGLEANRSVIPFSFGLPGSATTYACLPSSFPTLDEYNKGSWLIVPVLQ